MHATRDEDMSNEQQTQDDWRYQWAGFLDAQAAFYALPEQERIERVRAAFTNNEPEPF